MFQGKEITVFGATGFLGRHIVRRLAQTGATIRVPTRDLEKALILKPMGNVGQIVPLSCAIRSDVSVAAAIGPSFGVVNLLGILHEKGRDTFQSVHVEAAARIARIARANGARRFAHVSALGADAGSRSAYARSKAAGEQAVHAFFPSAVILRPGVVFGVEDNFFNMFASLARCAPFLPLIGGGRTRFQPVYVGDVASALVAALADPAMRGVILELGGPQIYSFRALMELMLSITRQRCNLVSMPWALAKLQAAFMELLPHPLLTRDQVELLKTDNIIGPAAYQTLRRLGVTPTALEVVLPTYLGRFRRAAN